MRTVILIIVFLLAATFMFQQVRAVASTSPNVDIAGEAASDRQRVEPTISVDPRNPGIIVAGSQDLRLVGVGEHRWHGYYRSTNGGQTWSSTLLPGFPGDKSLEGRSSPLHGSNATSDPVLVFDADGNVYYTGLVFNISATGALGRSQVFVAKYVNDGADYSGTALVPGTKFTDKPWIAVDSTDGHTRGTVYVAFDGVINGRFAILFTLSTDGGETFLNPTRVSKQDGLFSGVAVDPSGNVFVSSMSPGDSFQHISVSKSIDGGLSFESPVFVAKISPLPKPTLPGNGFRVFTTPQIAADSRGVYVVWDDFAGDQADILLARSTDGGETWKSPIMVNEQTAGEHFFPSIATSGGIISIAWYDSRLGQLSNGTITGLDLFYSESRDGGASFSHPNLRVTSTSFNPNLVKRADVPGANMPFIGDYISITASPTGVHPIWTDNRNACDTRDPKFGCVDQDAFTAAITP